MKNMLRKLNTMLEGFRGILAIWIPIVTAYITTVVMGLTSLSQSGIVLSAQLAIIPTIKLIWTDAIPKMVELYKNWLNK